MDTASQFLKQKKRHDENSSIQVNGAHKERGPVASVDEYLKPTHEQLPTLDQEVKDLGVESVVDKNAPDIDEESKKIGVRHSGEAVAFQNHDGNLLVDVLKSPEQIVADEIIIKQAKPTTAKRWMAVLRQYVRRKLGISV